MPLAKPVAASVSQKFAGTYSGEPVGYFVNASDGHPLKAYGSKFPSSIYHVDFHKGLDIYAAIGTPLAAMEAGTVIFAGTDSSGAKVIRVRIRGHANVVYEYGHCSSFVVGVGAVVKRGQVIAKMGMTGNATGSHVHVQVVITEKGSDGITRRMAYDPARFMPSGSYRMGAPYGGSIVPGGSHAFDDRIYPIHPATVNDGSHVRALPDVTSASLALTTAPTAVSQINLIPGGKWTVGGIDGTSWAKVKLASGQVGYVASSLIH